MPSPTIASLLQQFHNARDWGADAAGNRDASPAIQAALRAISDGGGGILFVPPGTYRLDSTPSFSGLSRVTLWLSNGVRTTGAGSWPASSGTNSVLDQREGAVPASVGSTVPTTSAPGDAASAGALSEAARADHRHGREAFGGASDIVTQAFGDAPAAGATGRVADAAHRHGMPATVPDGSVTTAKLADGAVATQKLADGAVTAAKVAADVATQAELDAHANASANVHGLPANVNVLGNRSAAGEFVQRGSGTISGTAGNDGSYGILFLTAVTFAVAFASTPFVVASGGGSNVRGLLAVNVSTTGFTPVAVGIAGGTLSGTYFWIALGA